MWHHTPVWKRLLRVLKLCWRRSTTGIGFWGLPHTLGTGVTRVTPETTSAPSHPQVGDRREGRPQAGGAGEGEGGVEPLYCLRRVSRFMRCMAWAVRTNTGLAKLVHEITSAP